MGEEKYDKEKDIAEWVAGQQDWRVKYARQQKYQAANMQMIAFKVNKKTEGEILDWLDAQPNKAGYIKRLIREDMERNKSE